MLDEREEHVSGGSAATGKLTGSAMGNRAPLQPGAIPADLARDRVGGAPGKVTTLAPHAWVPRGTLYEIRSSPPAEDDWALRTRVYADERDVVRVWGGA